MSSPGHFRGAASRRTPPRSGYDRGGPRFCLSAASDPDRPRPRNTATPPGPPPPFYGRPLLVLPRADRVLITFGGPPGRHLHTPTHAVQQVPHPGRGVVHAEPDGDHLGDPSLSPALTLGKAVRGRPGIQLRFQLPQRGISELAPRTTRTLRGQRIHAASVEGPPPPAHRHQRHPQLPGNPPVAGTLNEHPRRGQPHPLPPGPLPAGQPTTIGIPHTPGITTTAPTALTQRA